MHSAKKRNDIFTVIVNVKIEIFGGGGWIRTSDLWVMSPTSYQTALPRVIFS